MLCKLALGAYAKIATKLERGSKDDRLMTPIASTRINKQCCALLAID